MKYMKSSTSKIDDQIADIYTRYRDLITRYIFSKIGDSAVAEDLTHDVFIRVIEHKYMLNVNTISSFLFIIARNIIFDYLRRYYKKQEIDNHIYNMTLSFSNEDEENVVVNNLLSLEQYRLSMMPKQRKCIYIMSRFEEKTIAEIADALNISRRSVEGHLLLGRKEIRAFMSKCI